MLAACCCLHAVYIVHIPAVDFALLVDITYCCSLLILLLYCIYFIYFAVRLLLCSLSCLLSCLYVLRIALLAIDLLPGLFSLLSFC